MQLANHLRHLMVALILFLVFSPSAQAEVAWHDREGCRPYLTFKIGHPDFVTTFVKGSGDAATVNVEAILRHPRVNLANKGSVCGDPFLQGNPVELEARMLAHNPGLSASMSYNNFAGWLNSQNGRMYYPPMTSAHAAAWDQAAARRAAPAAAPAAPGHTAPRERVTKPGLTTCPWCNPGMKLIKLNPSAQE